MMDKTLISDKQLLFAHCITDGELDNMNPEQQSSIIHAINNIQKEHQPTESNRKNNKKISK